MKLSDLKVGDKFRFKACGFFDGTHVVTVAPGKEEFEDIQDAEVELITDPPEPQYRPFANAKEFAPHRERWLKEVAIKRFLTVTMYDACGIWHDGTQTRINWTTLLQDYTFDDGTPCGELVE